MIELQQVFKNYGEQAVLKGISLKIDKGERVAIIGPSGSGKSTLLRSINRLEEIDGGEIFLDGLSITSKEISVDTLRQRCGMVFQHFNLFNHKRVIDNLCLAPVALKKQSREEARKQALHLLERVGLKDRADAWPSQLSGGQKQRVAIARALAMNPELLLFDEPTSALDPEMVGEVLNVMRQLAEEGMTMIVVSHEMRFVRELASRVIFMDAGEVLADGSASFIFGPEAPARVQAFLQHFQA